MNHFVLTKTEAKDEPQKVELTLSNEIDDMVMQPLKKEWLLYILKGERKELEGKMIYYCFYLPSEDAELLKDAFMQAYTKATGYNTSN